MEKNTEKTIDLLKQWIAQSDSIVFFGGAGVSTESGIPDFRSVDGLYNQTYDYPPETIISHSFYVRNPQEFYRFYKDRMLFPAAKPNRAHLALAKLEQEGKLKTVITQNIDGLHQVVVQRGSGTPRLGTPQLLYPLRSVLRPGLRDEIGRGSEVQLRRDH